MLFYFTKQNHDPKPNPEAREAVLGELLAATSERIGDN